MIFVRDENELFERWGNSSEAVDVKTAEKVSVNNAINAYIVFSGCELDADGNRSVSTRFRVLRLNGIIYADHGFVAALREQESTAPGTPTSPQGSLQR